MLIGLDGDDTLWKNEDYFTGMQEEFQDFLTDLGAVVSVHEPLLEIENRNVAVYGYGKKSFLLSLFEFVTRHVAPSHQAETLRFVNDRAHKLMQQPAELLAGVEATLRDIEPLGQIVLITKGDVAEQQQKIADTGIGALVPTQEIVAQKDSVTYGRIIETYRNGSNKPFVMIGNSLRSDVLPIIELGHHAIHIPYHVTWAHEHVEMTDMHYHQVNSLAEAIPILKQITLAGY